MLRSAIHCLTLAAVPALLLLPINDPGPIAGHRLAYDSEARRMLVYSGVSAAASSDPYRSLLWSLADNRWVRLDSGGPPGRDDAQLAFDTRRRKLVLFGGRRRGATRDDMALLSDTWEWDQSAGWRLVDSIGPGRRLHGGMAYDERRGVMVLFGGFGEDESIRGDTWEWNGAQWRRAADGPARRWINGVVFDRRLGSIVLHAVAIDSVNQDTGLGHGELWRWDGSAWQSLGSGPPISPQTPTAGTDEGLLVFDGWARKNGARIADTWIWDGTRWNAGPAGPSARRGTSIAYDWRRRRTVLIGGETESGVSGDRWEFDGTRWLPMP